MTVRVMYLGLDRKKGHTFTVVAGYLYHAHVQRAMFKNHTSQVGVVALRAEAEGSLKFETSLVYREFQDGQG